MLETYHNWIKCNVPEQCVGICETITKRMMEEFPELIRVRGHVILLFRPDCDPYSHWWLKTATGEVVDPTRSQFPGKIVYDEWDESEPEPIGKCLNCGGYCYADSDYSNKDLCSTKCEKEYMAYLNNP